MNDARGGDETEGAGDKAGGAEAGVAIEPEIGSGGRRIASRTVVCRVNNGLAGEDTIHAERLLAAGKTVAGAQDASDVLQEPVVTREREVHDLHCRRVAPACRSAAGDHRD